MCWGGTDWNKPLHPDVESVTPVSESCVVFCVLQLTAETTMPVSDRHEQFVFVQVIVKSIMPVSESREVLAKTDFLVQLGVLSIHSCVNRFL